MSELKKITEMTFQQEVLESRVPVLVDFWASWCSPCRMVEPSLEKIDAQFGDRARVVRVNADQNPLLMQQYGVRGLPTVMLFVEGEPRHTALGVRSQQEYQQLLEDALAPPREGSQPSEESLPMAAAGASSTSS
jgi:thioredoxin 1